MTILHIASWYPNPWDGIEGNFVRDQIRVFAQEIPAEAIVVQVRSTRGTWPRLRFPVLEGNARGYFLLAPVKPGIVMEWLATLLLVVAMLRERAWRFDALHFHIAYPLLMHSRLWHWIFRRPIVITEHWSAYHDNFRLPENSPALKAIRRPFTHGFPVISVSHALLNDIRRFAHRSDFDGFVIPNVVPLHGVRKPRNSVPTLFAVNIWREIKDPMPMLAGLAIAAKSGAEFRLVLGGFGDMLSEMMDFVAGTALADRTDFPGKMTKAEIADALATADANLFSSRYETFSVACAEALGAGVPLIGPHVDAIAEYAGPDDWVRVETRDAAGWAAAVTRFIARHSGGEFDSVEIAARAAARFSPDSLRARYRSVMSQVLPGGSA